MTKIHNALIASFGFDIDFVLRRLASKRFDKVILLSLYTSPETYKRVEKAYHTLSIVCNSTRIDCELEKIDPQNIFRSVLSRVKGIAERSENIEIYLTGGPRILVIALALSTLLLPRDLVEKIKLVVEGEGFECEASVEVLTFHEITRLDERDLKLILEMQARGPLKISELAEYTGIPRSTIYRRLEDLDRQGLIEKRDDKYLSKDVFNIICK